MKGWLGRTTVSQKTMGRALRALFFLSLIPLVLIALYNYPADDDFSFNLESARAWQATGSLGAVLGAVAERTAQIYQVWQGNFVSTALFGLTALPFDIHWYFLSAWGILAMLCLSVGYLVKGVVRGLLGADKWAFWIAYPVIMTLVLQFMPSIGYGVYWHNGGMYTVAACTLFLLEGALARCVLPQSPKRRIWRCVCAALLGFCLGGSFYGPMLGALTLLVLQTLAAFLKRSKARSACAAALGFFGVALAISVLAPGNLLRQEQTGEALSPLRAVLTAALDSFDVAGQMLTPQVLAALLLLLPVLWKPLKTSAYAFSHPLWFAVSLYGLFSATLAPGIFTGFGYTTERYYNVIYFYFLFFALGSAVYGAGAVIRWMEKRPDCSVRVEDGFGRRMTAMYLAVCLGLFALGGFGYTIMNTSSLSAARSLLTGEAARFRQEMEERQEYILATDSDVVNVQPLSGQPHVFKEDKLPWQGIYGRVRYMKWYFELFQ